MTVVKEKLLAEIETLPEHRIAEVLDYIHFLQYQESHLMGETAAVENGTDPMSEFIGGVEVGNLAQDIDEELYQ
ncbi:MAG: DUF2281 domain-containing protein [Anaerolineales bacterium]|nr:DUF2281 domain-containing protein [Anaerolineales bacterium]